jgi:hypothetical protein
MKLLSSLLFFLVLHTGYCQSYSISAGISYRTYPIDIENVPPGPAHGDASFYSSRFWKPLSVQWSTAKYLPGNWTIQLSNVIRYNHTNWKTGVNYNVTNPPKRPEAKSFKYDFIFDIERQMPIRHSQKSAFCIQLGVGAVNLNSGFDVKMRDTLPTGLTDLRHYKGSFAKISPHLGIGYKMDKFKLMIDCLVVEGPTFQNLSSLWIGASVVYEIWKH